jgi:DNA relaxase NicK
VDLASRYLLLECGVDWITATASSQGRANALASRLREYVDERGSEGYQIKPWSWNGYVGSNVDGASWGKRDDGVIVRLSGSMCMRHWKSVLVFADNVSRIDVQATALDRDGTADHAYNGWVRVNEMSAVQAGMTHARFTISAPSGATLNVGSRSSDRYLRLYDKSAESQGEYPYRSWRYEVEYKGRRAYRVAQAIYTGRHEATYCHQQVEAAFVANGLHLVAPAPTFSWRDAGVIHVTDDQRRLEWVRRCIRPVIGRLVEAYTSDTVAQALGFTIYPNEEEPGAVAWFETVEPDPIRVI